MRAQRVDARDVILAECVQSAVFDDVERLGEQVGVVARARASLHDDALLGARGGARRQPRLHQHALQLLVQLRVRVHVRQIWHRVQSAHSAQYCGNACASRCRAAHLLTRSKAVLIWPALRAVRASVVRHCAHECSAKAVCCNMCARSANDACS